ncbi:fragmin60 [Athelia psychrophila]|uniref:Fragmin60 n=1 Tax=Athelia psychrophila TaxID=1759441 RepID=A0A166H871_9AGAM|nr:fragmin60 [Fibularhizoctonia sp. CBS 109695]
MAHLNQPTRYDIADSNIALLGSDLEKTVREHAGDKDSAWTEAGKKPGLEIWRIEKFNVVAWPAERVGSFYDGDSYIILHTYKKTPDSESLSFDLHFWLGENTSQDEAGTAAYKTVELDDHLEGAPVQYREVQGSESTRFLSYFPRFVCLRGGVSTGFHHVSSAPPPDVHRLYKISLSREANGRPHLQVREVPIEGSSLVEGAVFVLDKGPAVWQFNTKTSVGQEKFRAAEFAHSLLSEREAHKEEVPHVYDEGAPGASKFLAELGLEAMPSRSAASSKTSAPPTLYRMSDASGSAAFEPVDPPALASLSSEDAFLLDHSGSAAHPAIYIWIGKSASLTEQRLALQYAQNFAHKKQAEGGNFKVSVSLVKVKEGHESSSFIAAFVV